MVHAIHVDSLEADYLHPYRTLRQPVEHFKQGIFVAEGTKVVERLIQSDHEVISLLLTPEWLSFLQSRISNLPNEPYVYVAEKKVLEQIVGFHLHQGIMAIGRIPRALRLSDLLVTSPRPYLFAAVDGLTNSENLGVLVRNCAAFGVHGLLVGETSSSPYLRRAVRNSMGAIFKLPVIHLNDLAGTLKDLRKEHRIQIFAAHPHTNEVAVQTAALSDNCCIVFGSEGEGISDDVLAACDQSVAIPMNREIDSLNVASASAVFLYEAYRQRNTP